MGKIKKFVFKHKSKIGFALAGAVLIFVIPICINLAYGASHKIFFTQWGAEDTLSYYSTILGASATIAAVYATIKSTSKSAQADRNHTVKINHYNLGVQVCFDFIESCDFGNVYNILIREQLKCKRNETDYNEMFAVTSIEISNVIDSVKKNQLKFYFLYPKLRRSDKNYIRIFVDNYTDMLMEISELVIIPDKGIDVDLLKGKKEEYDKIYWDFCYFLRDAIASYQN